MAEENKQPVPTITSQTAQREPRTIQTAGPTGSASASLSQPSEQKVSVRALRTVHKDPSLQGEVARPGDTFEVTRTRAAELRANGIIEYANDADEVAIHGDRADALRERAKRDADSRKIPDQHKAPPLRNPEVKLADLPNDKR